MLRVREVEVGRKREKKKRGWKKDRLSLKWRLKKKMRLRINKNKMDRLMEPRRNRKANLRNKKKLRSRTLL